MEVLCAIVVVAMSAVFFAATVSAAGRINSMARESEDRLYTALGTAETQASGGAQEDAAIMLTVYQAGSDTTPLFQREVKLYGDSETLLSYRLK